MATAKVLAEKKLKSLLKSDFDPKDIRLSESGHKCRRLRVLRALGYEPAPVADDVLGLFETGNVWEEWFHGLLREEYPRKTRTQMEVQTPYGATGHMDVWFPKPPADLGGGRPRFYECKAVREGAKYYGLPKDEHLYQVQAYHHFGRKYGIKWGGQVTKLPDDTVAEIVYIIRETLEVIPYEVEYSPDIGEEIETETRRVRRMIDSQEVPPVELGHAEFPCYYQTKDYEVYCPFYIYCHADAESQDDGALVKADLEPKLKEYDQVRGEYSAKNKAAQAVKTKKKAVEKELDGLFNALGTDAVVAGDLKVHRTLIKGRIYPDVDKALKMGRIDLKTYNAIMEVSNKGSDYYRWYVKDLSKKKGGKKNGK